jgi:hypothetical protein
MTSTTAHALVFMSTADEKKSELSRNLAQSIYLPVHLTPLKEDYKAAGQR